MTITDHNAVRTTGYAKIVTFLLRQQYKQKGCYQGILDRLDLTLPWLPQESAAMGCSHRQIWAAGMSAPTGTACRLAVQYPDTVLITTERHKCSKDLWGRAEKLLVTGSKDSWGSCENHPLCKYCATVSVPVACIFLPLSPYDLAFSAPFLYHLCTHMCIDVYPYWSIRPMHYLID